MPNPYPGVFTQLLDALPPGSVAIDLGSGGRSHPGLVSLEYTAHPNNSLQGDCLRLPFRDECADLLLSQAVIEHVTDPAAAFAEMRRVLKPGGTLYVEIAFMQPVHMAPYHYFNVTPHGLAWLLCDWDVQWQGAIGTAQEVFDWVGKTYGVTLRPGRSRTLKDVPASRYELAASGVSALARRPV